jgi:hypothetical protein
MEIEFGYTAMHNLCNSIEVNLTYFSDTAEIVHKLHEMRNQMGNDAEEELNRVLLDTASTE